MFGETDVDRIIAEAAACHRAHPDNHVRLIGFDNYAQSKGTEMVIYRGDASLDGSCAQERRQRGRPVPRQ